MWLPHKLTQITRAHALSQWCPPQGAALGLILLK
jgi:hypothetical protein